MRALWLLEWRDPVALALQGLFWIGIGAWLWWAYAPLLRGTGRKHKGGTQWHS